jgi:glycosyltransferase involved in cell wall biosynthesis
MRLAWFSPWPPDRSGIAGRSAELVPLLAARGHGVDVFVDERRVPVARANDEAPSPGQVRVQSAHDFVWRAGRAQYDLIVYQLGNSRLHGFIWPYLFRWPGLAVLHDARLHHARGRALLRSRRTADYRAEFTWSHPEVPADAAELAISGFGGVYYYQWPMTRAVVESSRLTAAHSRGGVAELALDWPDRPVEYIALGEGRASPATDPVRNARRASLAVSDTTVLFGMFGSLTAEKRVLQVMRAFAATRARTPDVHLLLAGGQDGSVEVARLSHDLGIEEVTTVVDAPNDREFDEWIAAVDISLHLRWPTALETSGPWLRALAAARPTVIVDLAHLSHVPALDARTWQLQGPVTGRRQAGPPVAVAIDILDEDHSLRLAMARLAADADLRRSLGTAARAYWEREHTVERMVEDYERVMRRAVTLTAPAGPRPSHLRPDPLARTRKLALSIDPGFNLFGTQKTQHEG